MGWWWSVVRKTSEQAQGRPLAPRALLPSCPGRLPFQPELVAGSQLRAIQPHLALSAATSWAPGPAHLLSQAVPDVVGPLNWQCEHALGICFHQVCKTRKRLMKEEVYTHRSLETGSHGEGPGWVRRQKKESADHAWSFYFGFHRKE